MLNGDENGTRTSADHSEPLVAREFAARPCRAGSIRRAATARTAAAAPMRCRSRPAPRSRSGGTAACSRARRADSDRCAPAAPKLVAPIGVEAAPRRARQHGVGRVRRVATGIERDVRARGPELFPHRVKVDARAADVAAERHACRRAAVPRAPRSRLRRSSISKVRVLALRESERSADSRVSGPLLKVRSTSTAIARSCRPPRTGPTAACLVP